MPSAERQEAAQAAKAGSVEAAPGFEVHVGFSTTRGPLSRLIRWLTASKASHCFLVYPCGVFRSEMVLEATGAGFRVMSWRKFARENRIVAIYRIALDEACLRAGLAQLAHRLGDAYDTFSLIGHALRGWFNLKRVPFDSRDKLVCSEAVALYLGHCGVDVGDACVVTPRDLMELARKRTDVFLPAETARWSRRGRRKLLVKRDP